MLRTRLGNGGDGSSLCLGGVNRLLVMVLLMLVLDRVPLVGGSSQGVLLGI